MSNVSIYCFPFAGGSAGSYYGLKKALEQTEGVLVVPMELRGRGSRFSEPLYDSFEDAIEDAYQQVKKHLNGERFIIFGHSMGAILAYEVSRKINLEDGISNFTLIVSGMNPPHARKKENLHSLSIDEFMVQMEKLGGIPKEVLENKELYKMCSRIMFSDVSMLELYESEKAEPLLVPICVLYGEKDSVTNERIYEWSSYTEKECEIHSFPEGHFYIFDKLSEVCQLFKQQI